MGMDIYDKLIKTQQSLLSMTVSVNEHASRYWTATKTYADKPDFESLLQSCIVEAIQEYKKQNDDANPQRIIVYRLAGTAQQRTIIKQIEVRAFQNAFNDLHLNPKPELIHVTLAKDMTTKFCSAEAFENQNVKYQNPKPGTVIDSQIMRNRDFYLISSSPGQGTSLPMHYDVLSYLVPNGNGEMVEAEVSDDLFKKIQLITYKLCYLNFNKKGCYKMPAPIHFANKLATWIGNVAENGKLSLPMKVFQEPKKSMFFL
jgi:hypothetical protein